MFPIPFDSLAIGPLAQGRPCLRSLPLRAGMVILIGSLALAACGSTPRSGKVLDEAMRANRTAASFPAADEDYFKEMDGGIPLTPEEVQGRNMWNVWTGGNDRFWVSGAFGAPPSFGIIFGGDGRDLLQTNIGFHIDMTAGTVTVLNFKH